MLRPLRDHVMNLEYRLQCLGDGLTRTTLTDEERAHREMKMRLSVLALKYCIKAFELEQKCD